jgi:AcrR family transcriptional regulator
MPGARTTRQRLLDEAMRLFAERGFRATTVGAIEAAAGLVPRRGALYKHFPSKEALLDAAVRAHLDRVAAVASQLGSIDVSATTTDPIELRPLVYALGEWVLNELEQERDLTFVIEHDGRGLLAGVASEVRQHLVDTAHGAAANLLAALAPNAPDAEATAVLLLSALAGYIRVDWTYGSTPLGVDRGRALAAWTELTLQALGAAS